jgi:hypothetical protein
MPRKALFVMKLHNRLSLARITARLITRLTARLNTHPTARRITRLTARLV